VTLVLFVATSAAAARGTSFRGYKNAAFPSCLRVLVANNRCAATTERGPPCRRCRRRCSRNAMQWRYYRSKRQKMSFDAAPLLLYSL
jgi:hypothetical protein